MIENNLSTLMGAKRIRVAEIVRNTGLAYSTVSVLFHNKSKGIEFVTLDKLCSALECTPSDLFTYTPD